MKILFSNIGYATGINGSFHHHVSKVLRHAHQTVDMQRSVLDQFARIVEREAPDLCCMVELDQGSIHSGHYNQIEALTSAPYPCFDIADKYGPDSPIAKLPFHMGKSNGFIARRPYTFERLYFAHGTKRLIYKLALKPGLTLFFAHFSLKAKVRTLQFGEMRGLAEAAGGEVIVLGDFNTLTGLAELAPLTAGNGLRLLNRPGEPTFRFLGWQHTLDLCLCSPSLEPSLQLHLIPQPFSDHCALLISDRNPNDNLS